MTIQRIVLSLLLGLMALSQIAASCASTPEREPAPQYGSPDQYPSQYPNQYPSRYDPPPPGYERPRRIPRNADLVRYGNDRQRWVADMSGEVFVYDVTDDRIVYQGPIRRDQEIIVNPERDRIYIAEREVYTDNLRRAAPHQIYFAPEGGRANRPPPQAQQQPQPQQRPRPDARPPGSQLLTDGRGDIGISRAQADGTIYVFDEDDVKMLHSTAVRRGDSFDIVLETGRVNVNGRRVATVKFDTRHRHSFYFSPR